MTNNKLNVTQITHHSNATTQNPESYVTATAYYGGMDSRTRKWGTD